MNSKALNPATFVLIALLCPSVLPAVAEELAPIHSYEVVNAPREGLKTTQLQIGEKIQTRFNGGTEAEYVGSDHGFPIRIYRAVAQQVSCEEPVNHQQQQSVAVQRLHPGEALIINGENQYICSR